MNLKKYVLFACIALVSIFFYANANARSVFLPDWQEADLKTDGKDFSRDENWCQTAVKTGTQTLIYHKAKECPAPKTHDDWCEHDPDNWITECYCPSHFNKSCVYPFKGDERKKEQHFTRDYKSKKSVPTGRYYASCDGKYVECCDTRCPQGSLGHPGSGYCYNTTANGCGETCYYNVRSDSCNRGGSKSNPGGCYDTYSNDCGSTCYVSKTCPPPPAESGSSGGGSGSSGGSGGGGGGGGVSSITCPSGKVAGRMVARMSGSAYCGAVGPGTCGGKGYTRGRNGKAYCVGNGKEELISSGGGYDTSGCYSTMAACQADLGGYSGSSSTDYKVYENGSWVTKSCCI